MEIRPYVALMIAGCGIVTLLPRIAPFILLRKVQLPDWARHWLSFVPVTVMSTLCLSAIQGSSLDVPTRITACVASLIVALWSRSLFLTVLAGVLTSTFADSMGMFAP